MGNITLKNVHKAFGATVIIPDIDLEISDGEFVVFVGPSGCGKSTLLRLIAGLEDTTSGTILIDGADMTGEAPAKRGLAMVFQSYALYPHMSVYNNIAFPLKMAKADKQTIDAKVRAAAQTLNLTAYLERRPGQLSGGQRQRVAIGRAIVRNPDVFLFDEPLSNLDAELRVKMRLEIAKLHKDLGATMVYVTHDQVEAMTLADKIVVLRAGLVEQIGSPMTLYSDPDNRFVAGFIGSPRMNFIDASVSGIKDGALLVDVPELDLSGLPVRPRAMPAKAPATVTLGIRPEHLSEGADGPFRITLACNAIERLGAISYLYTAPGDDATIIAQLKGASGVRVSETVTVGVDPEACFLFDDAGQRI